MVGRIECGFETVSAPPRRDGLGVTFECADAACPPLPPPAAAAAAAATEKSGSSCGSGATPQTILRILGSDATAPDASGRQRRRIAANLKAGIS